MTAIDIILGVLLLISSVLIIAVILLQEGRQAGISGAIAGGADSFLGKNKGHTMSARLEKWTKVIAIGFFLLTLAANIVAYFVK